MNYANAWKKLIDRKGWGVLGQVFLARSILMDFLGNSAPDIGLVDVFFLFNERAAIQTWVLKEDYKSATKRLQRLISLAPSRFSNLEYQAAIKPLLQLAFPQAKIATLGIAQEGEAGRVSIIRRKKEYCSSSLEPSKASMMMTKPKKRKKKTVVSTLSISAICQELTVFPTDGELKIVDGSGTDVTGSVPLTQSHGNIGISLLGKRQKYSVWVPKKQYRKMDLSLHTSHCTLGGILEDQILAKTLNLSASKGVTVLHGEFDYLSVCQKAGEFYFLGRAKKASVVGEKTDLYYLSTDNEQDECTMVTKTGDIRLEFFGFRVKPKISHLFRSVHTASGVYSVGTKKVAMNLCSEQGRLRVK